MKRRQHIIAIIELDSRSDSQRPFGTFPVLGPDLLGRIQNDLHLGDGCVWRR